jgi:dihydrofolate reductase
VSKLVVSEFVTLDGVFEDPGGAEGMPYGGWAFEFDQGPEGRQFKLDELMAAEALLLGRVTYEGFAAAWPKMEGTGAFGERMNSIPKYVVSSTLESPEWNNTSVIECDGLAQQVGRLKGELTGDVLLNGSGRLACELAGQDLVDEYRLMVFPIVIGRGKRLFDGLASSQSLRLVSSQPAGDTVILTLVPRELA